MGAREATEGYLQAVYDGRIDDIAAMFAGDVSIDDPMHGRADGRDGLIAFIVQASAWLKERKAQFSKLRTTHTDEHTVVEWVVKLDHQRKAVDLPVAVVGDHPEGQLKQIRVYHSLWPLIGTHKVRAAILEAHGHLPLRDVVKAYQDALLAGDVDAIVGTFEPEGYFREPAGGEHVYRGETRLRELMTGLFSVGGITLDHVTVTDDGVACAIEFNAVAFGTNPLIPQAGVAVYERGASGKLIAARIYDDVNVEAFAGQ